MIESCNTCKSCKEGLNQYCDNGYTATYNGNQRHPSKDNVTRGGYSEAIVVNEDYVLRLPEAFATSNPMDLAAIAPIVCAGVTVYSPLKHWRVGKGTSCAIVGYGGLGHLAVKIAKALGAEVTVISSDPKSKAQDAIRNGAKRVIDSTDNKAMASVAKAFDFVLSTVPVSHDIMPFVDTLARDGVLCIVGAIAPTKGSIDFTHMVFDRRTIASSVLGSIAESQECLEFCAKHGIKPDIKLISVDDIGDAFSEIHDGDTSFRYVIDVSTMHGKSPDRTLTAQVGL